MTATATTSNAEIVPRRAGIIQPPVFSYTLHNTSSHRHHHSYTPYMDNNNMAHIEPESIAAALEASNELLHMTDPTLRSEDPQSGETVYECK